MNVATQHEEVISVVVPVTFDDFWQMGNKVSITEDVTVEYIESVFISYEEDEMDSFFTPNGTQYLIFGNGNGKKPKVLKKFGNDITINVPIDCVLIMDIFKQHDNEKRAALAGAVNTVGSVLPIQQAPVKLTNLPAPQEVLPPPTSKMDTAVKVVTIAAGGATAILVGIFVYDRFFGHK